MNIFPNPTNDVINIETGDRQNKIYEIHNVLGQIILQKNSSSSSEKINVSTLPKGLYFLTIKNAAGEILASEKILIQ